MPTISNNKHHLLLGTDKNITFAQCSSFIFNFRFFLLLSSQVEYWSYHKKRQYCKYFDQKNIVVFYNIYPIHRKKNIEINTHRVWRTRFPLYRCKYFQFKLCLYFSTQLNEFCVHWYTFCISML